MRKDLPNKFNVPNDYFQDLEKEILRKTQSSGPTKVVTLYTKYWLAATTGLAASVLILIGIFQLDADPPVTQADHIQAKEILLETYLEEDGQLDEFVLDDEPLYAEILQ